MCRLPRLRRAGALAALLLSAGCASTPITYGPETRESGLVVQDVVVPKGPAAAPGDRVSIHYHGVLPDGSVFDSTVERGQPVAFEIGAGRFPAILEEGVVGMHLLGRRRLSAVAERVFPAGLPDGVPAGALLSFEVELLALEPREPPAAPDS